MRIETIYPSYPPEKKGVDPALWVVVASLLGVLILILVAVDLEEVKAFVDFAKWVIPAYVLKDKLPR